MIENNISIGEYLKKCRTEETEYTREQVAAQTSISSSRLEKIERGKLAVNAQDIVELAEVYKLPSLCNYYCNSECPIGTAPDSGISRAADRELPQIVLSLLNSINRLESQKERMVEITVDGKIEDNELRDYLRLEKSLQEISDVAASLSLWVRKQILEGIIDEDSLENEREIMEKLQR
jgi:transcriptional regulator with XRE-family HTH domain